MNDVVKAHPKLKSFSVHGVEFRGSNETQAWGDCPFCGKTKLYVNHKTRAWDCKTCGKEGGLNTFLAEMSIIYKEQMTRRASKRLAKDRGLKRSTLRAFCVGYDGTSTYMIPIVIEGKTLDIRRYKLGGKLMSTPGAHSPVVIMPGKSKRSWLCEGEWDGMVVWEALQKNGLDDTVVAVTGALQFPSKMAPMFQGKVVMNLFDYDETGPKGDAKVRRFLDGYAKKIYSLHWPKGTEFDWDVRDQYGLFEHNGPKLITFLKKNSFTDPLLVLETEKEGEEGNITSVEELDGQGLPRRRVLREYRKWLELPRIQPIDVMYGSVFANRLSGDPLWMFLVGPPGCGKTEQLMTLNEAPLIMTTTSLTSAALISGANFFGGGDPSLIPRLNGKALIIKDFTTILKMHYQQRDEIFGILRDAYDGRVEKWFGTGTHRMYESCFGILAGVTPAIEEYSAMFAVLGERFIKYRFPPVTYAVECRIIRRALLNIAKEPELRAELMEISAETLNRPIDPSGPPEIDENAIQQIIGLARWVARLRAVVSREKYTGQVIYRPSHEMGTRLAKQLAKLGMGIALFHHRDKVVPKDMKAVVRVARDSAPDIAEEIVKQMYLRGKHRFSPTKEIAGWTFMTNQTTLKVLQDLNLLRIVDRQKGARMSSSWKLSSEILGIMEPLELYATEEEWLAGGQSRRIVEETKWRAKLRERGQREKRKAREFAKTKRGMIKKRRLV